MPTMIFSVSQVLSRLLRYLLIAAGVGVTGCSVAQVKDEWLNFRTVADSSSRRWDEVPARNVHRVAYKAVPEALRLLNEQPLRRLQSKEVRELVGKDLTPAAGSSFYLLRAVRTASDHGAFTVLGDGRALVSRYTALSKGREKAHRDGLVVELQTPPLQLFVELEIAE